MKKSFTFILQQANYFDVLKVREDIFKPRSLVECEFRYSVPLLSGTEITENLAEFLERYLKLRSYSENVVR